MKKAAMTTALIIGTGLSVQSVSADESVKTESQDRIEIQTVYYTGNKATETFSQDTQDLLVPLNYYNNNKDDNSGVSAIIVPENNLTENLYSSKAVLTVESSQKIEEAIQKEKEEIERKQEEERRREEERLREEERQKQEEEKRKKEAALAESRKESVVQTYSVEENNQSTVQSTGSGFVSGSHTPIINYSGNTYPVGQCTWGAKALAPWAGNYWGNAGNWANAARSQGFRVGTTPMPGAIAVWPYVGYGYGHVAVITDVQSETLVQMQEANFNGNQFIGNFRGWTNPLDPIAGGGYVEYIYPPGT